MRTGALQVTEEELGGSKVSRAVVRHEMSQFTNGIGDIRTCASGKVHALSDKGPIGKSVRDLLLCIVTGHMSFVRRQSGQGVLTGLQFSNPKSQRILQTNWL
jgi:hypothetical protein